MKRLLPILLLAGAFAYGQPVRKMPGQPEGVAGNLQLAIRRASVSALERTNVIRIDQLELTLQVPSRQAPDDKGRPYWQYDRAEISTSVDVLEGKRAVVGKANVQDTGAAIFAVLAARVVE